MDATNFSTSNIVQSNDGSSSLDRVIDWSQIEIAPANEDEIDVPVAEENLCLMLGINDKSGHRRAIAGAAIEASIANINASMDDIDEDLLADAALPVSEHMPEENHFWYDKEHPVIEEGSLFSSMEEFRMLLRTFAIRGKFDIQIQDSDTTRFIGTANTNFHPHVHDYYSVSMFRAAYAGEIEPITGKSQWPQVTLGFEMVPPISKRPIGRQRKLRIKGCLEDGGGSSKGKKKVDCKGKEQDDGDEEKSQENSVKGKEKEKKRFGTTSRCKLCGELGHRRTGCPQNEPRERKKKAKKVHKGEHQISGEVIEQQVCSSLVGTPKRTTITLPPSLHDSPGPITRRRLAMAIAGDGASQAPMTTAASPSTPSFHVPSCSNACKKKLTPKRRKQ
ncbi:unnamed protein product [Alopecurus aequalis]